MKEHPFCRNITGANRPGTKRPHTLLVIKSAKDQIQNAMSHISRHYGGDCSTGCDQLLYS